MLALARSMNLDTVLDAAAGLNPTICRRLGNAIFTGLRKQQPWTIHRAAGSSTRLQIVGPGQTPRHRYAETTILSMHMSLYLSADRKLGTPELALNFERAQYWEALDELDSRQRTGWYRALEDHGIHVLWYRNSNAHGAYLWANPSAPAQAPQAAEALGRALAVSGDLRWL